MKKRVFSILLIFSAVCLLFAVDASAAEVKFSRDTVNLYALQTYRLSFTKAVSDIEFVSSDEKIVSVDNEGVVTAITSGKAEIYAVSGTKVRATCTVNVISGNAPSSVELNSQSITLDEGKTHKLKATIMPEDTSDKSVYYSSSNEKVAKVDKNGKITAVKAGVAVITVESSSSAISNKCVVKVLSKSDKTNTKVDIDGVLYSIAGEKKAKMKVVLRNSVESVSALTDENGKFYFEDVLSGAYKMYVYNDEKSTKVVCSASVTVFTYNMNISCIINDDDLVVLYKEEKVSTDKIKDITLDKTAIEIDTGDTYDMSFTVRPANAGTPSLRAVSSNTDVATVDADCRITAVSGGKATITFSTLDGKISKKCVVRVNETNSNQYRLLIVIAEMAVLAVIFIAFWVKYKKFMKVKEEQEERETKENERNRENNAK